MTEKSLEKNIPKEWRRVKLGNISDITNGKTNSQDAALDGKYPLFDRSVAVKRSNKYLFDNTAVILPGEGAEFIPRFYSGKFDLHQRAYAIFPHKDVYPLFLFQYLNANRGIFRKNAVGSTVKSLRLPIIKKVDVVLPPLAEQKNIAEILSSIDGEIEKTEQIISTTEKLKRGLMQNMFTIKGVNIKLGEIATIVRGGSPRPIENFFTDERDGLNWLKIGDVELGAKYITHTGQKIKKSGLSKTTMVHIGDFILSNSMSFGRPYIMKTDACIHDGWLAFKDIKTNLIVTEFLYYLLSSELLQNNFTSVAAGSGVKNLKRESVANILISLPTIDVQKRIATVLSSIDDKISINKKLKSRLFILKKGLMQDLLVGKVRTI